jgi:hypothetical protein
MSNYHVRSDDIVAYAFQAAFVAPDCIAMAFGQRHGETPEETLDRVAAERGVDPAVERDTNVFPQPVFASDVDGGETCDRCLLRISEH